MPTNKELEKQLKDLRKTVEENINKHKDLKDKTKWSDSKGAILLQIIIAIAALAIAIGQFRLAHTQTELSRTQTILTEIQTETSKRQAEMQSYQLIKELSELENTDTPRVNNQYNYINRLDSSTLESYLTQVINRDDFDYSTLKAYQFHSSKREGGISELDVIYLLKIFKLGAMAYNSGQKYSTTDSMSLTNALNLTQAIHDYYMQTAFENMFSTSAYENFRNQFVFMNSMKDKPIYSPSHTYQFLIQCMKKERNNDKASEFDLFNRKYNTISNSLSQLDQVLFFNPSISYKPIGNLITQFGRDNYFDIYAACIIACKTEEEFNNFLPHFEKLIIRYSITKPIISMDDISIEDIRNDLFEEVDKLD